MADFKIKGNAVIEGSSLTIAGVAVPTNDSSSTLTNKTIDADSNTITNIENADIKAGAAIALDKLAAVTASRALVSDGSGVVSVSSVTSAEVAHLSGVTSAIQTQLNDKVDDSEKGANNGVATLDAGGKIPAAQLPSSVMSYEGTFDASSIPASPLLNGDVAADAGMVYLASVAGSYDFGAGAIAFLVGDWAVYNGTIWEKSVNSNAVVSVNSQTGVVVLDSDDISEGTTNLYHTDERSQDSVGSILADSASIDFTYDDVTPSITAVVLPAGVDHDALSNFVANEHVDHTSVSIATAAQSGLTGGGDISATRNLSVDINGTTAETSTDDADAILIYDDSAAVLKKMTRANFLSGIPTSSAGDIDETSMALAESQTNQDVTGFAFANATVRSFKALVSVEIDATAGLYEAFEILGVQKGSSWDISQTATGDSSLVTFSITNAGQIQYSSSSYAGFVSGAIKFRAITVSV